MDLRPPTVRSLLGLLQRLPGIGPRSARHLVEHLLTMPEEEVASLAAALGALRSAVRHCPLCSVLTETEPCPVCSDPGRDQGVILVVEEPTAVWSVEATGEYRGLYHALLGHLSPLRGIGPADLTIDRLLERAGSGAVREVILATDPTVEGETTALYIARRLQPLGVDLTRLASGIPVGGEVAAGEHVTLGPALPPRRRL
jgi:recombination protein RecR